MEIYNMDAMTHPPKVLPTNIDSTSTIKKEKKPKKKRCAKEGCKKKLGLVPLKCNCLKLFCAEHLQPELHKCTFDYIKQGQDKIRRENPVVINSKINHI